MSDLNARDVEDAILDFFLEKNAPADALEIALKMGSTAAKVRAAIERTGHGRIDSSATVRPSYSKNYRGVQTGVHRVTVYSPSKSFLRNELLDWKRNAR